MKTIYNFLVKNKKIFSVILTLLYFSIIISHNSHLFLYLNGLNSCTKYLDIFWNIWNLTLLRQADKKQSICSDYSITGAFINGQSEQQFKIQCHFVIFYSKTGEGKGYDDAASQALKWIYEWFVNLCFL